MKTKNTVPTSMRVNQRTRRHLTAATKYFGCSVGSLICLLLDACFISELDETQVPKENVDHFFKNINDGVDSNNYLFKD